MKLWVDGMFFNTDIARAERTVELNGMSETLWSQVIDGAKCWFLGTRPVWTHYTNFKRITGREADLWLQYGFIPTAEQLDELEGNNG